MEEAIQLIKMMWTHSRATFRGNFFRVDNAILEPKPMQKPHPPIMIGGSGEQLTLRAVARVGDMCNIFGDPKMVKSKFDILRQHCDKQGRNYDDITKTNTTAFLLAPNETALQAKKEKYGVADGFRGNALTPSQAIDLAGQYQDAGVQIMIFSAYKNDRETLDLFASEVMPKFDR